MKHRFATLLGSALLAGASVMMMARAAETTAAPITDAPTITQEQLLERLGKQDPDIMVLDVRTPAEFAAGHVPGARNISHDLLASRVTELASVRDKQVVLYCRSGRRTLLAEQTLRDAGFTKLLHLKGDYLAWEAEHRPIERSAPATPADSR